MLSPSMSGEIHESSINSALASPEATLVADDEGRYVAANEAACRLLGYTREELLQLSVWDLTPDPHEVEGLILWKEFIEIGAQAGGYWLKRKDGSPIEVAYQAQASIAPGRHVSRLVPHDSLNEPFERSRFPRRGRS
jgi:PAS domain S-box-containing protein